MKILCIILSFLLAFILIYLMIRRYFIDNYDDK